MKLSLECPDELLDMVQPFADFDWILVNRYLESGVYAEYYRNSDKIKFVDNSVTEKGEPCSAEELRQVMDDCKADYVIAPDWIGEYKKTVEAYRECIGKLPKEKVIGVLQGGSPEEALKCLEVYEHKIVAVPYRVGGSEKGDPNELMALRRELVVAHVPSDRLVHLLGYTHSSEFAWYVNRPNIWGVDTDVPIRAGLAGQDLDDFDRTQKVSTDLNKENWAATCRNIALLRKYMS